MYRVLVPVDKKDDQAEELVKAVVDLAEVVSELEVIVIHVFCEMQVPPQVTIHQPTNNYEELIDELHETPASLLKVMEDLDAASVEADVRIEEGDPARTIIECAEELNIDNIYIGGRTHSPTGKVLFGSVTQAVLLNTDIPVTVIGTNAN